MGSQLIFGYVLHVNGQPTSVSLSLDETKSLALQHMASNATLQINSGGWRQPQHRPGTMTMKSSNGWNSCAA